MTRTSIRTFGGLTLLSLSVLLPMAGRAGDFHSLFPTRDQRLRMPPSDCRFGFYGTSWRAFPDGCDAWPRDDDRSRGMMPLTFPIQMLPIQPTPDQTLPIQSTPIPPPPIPPSPNQPAPNQPAPIPPTPAAMFPASVKWSSPAPSDYKPYSQSRYPQVHTSYLPQHSLPYQQTPQFSDLQLPTAQQSAPSRLGQMAVPGFATAPKPPAIPVPPTSQAMNRFVPLRPTTMIPAPHSDGRGVIPAAVSLGTPISDSPPILQSGFTKVSSASQRSQNPVTLLPPE